MDREKRTSVTMIALAALFALLVAGFALDLWGRPRPLPDIPPVDPEFLDTAPWRQSYSDLEAAGEDVSYFDCYLCHEENVKLELDFDEKGFVKLPEEHEDIIMGHGTNARTNLCFNCHKEDRLTHLQTLDGRDLTIGQSTILCGSCHSPIYEDWLAGSHGRTSGHWDRTAGEFKKLDCVNCHDPHSPAFPGREPAPGPHYLHGGPSPKQSAHD